MRVDLRGRPRWAWCRRGGRHALPGRGGGARDSSRRAEVRRDRDHASDQTISYAILPRAQ